MKSSQIPSFSENKKIKEKFKKKLKAKIFFLVKEGSGSLIITNP